MKSHRSIGDEESVQKELEVHGQRWASIFDGYFSDPEVARPLVEAVERAIDASRPAVVADLGGGTGFVLEELLRRGLRGIRLVNVDVSEKQLGVCEERRIVPLRASADKVVRHQLLGEDERLLLMARSMFHYFGRSGDLCASVGLLQAPEGRRPHEPSLRAHADGKISDSRPQAGDEV